MPAGPSHPDDLTARLLAESRAGSREAMGALLERHLPGLRAFVRLHLGPALRAFESESDLVQTVCAELLKDLDGFEYRGEAQFRQWLCAAALNKIRNRQRHHHAQRRRGSEAVEPFDDALFVGSQAAFASPSHHAVRREQVDLLERAFAALPPHYRDVLVLMRIVGLSQEEAAARLGRTVPSTRNLLSRALVKLAGCMAEARRGT